MNLELIFGDLVRWLYSLRHCYSAELMITSC